MKKIFTFIFVALTFFGASCLAQGGKQGGKQSMELMKQRLKDSLKLSDVQIDSVVSIRQEFQPQIKSIMKDGSLSKDQKKEKVKPLKKEMIARLKTFLTKDQIEKINDMEQEMRKKNANDGG